MKKSEKALVTDVYAQVAGGGGGGSPESIILKN
jgi:hypothetical protein